VLALATDPLEVDTDLNGIWDKDEDFDSDNLNNLGEYQNGTEPFIPDTDEDGLLDGDEVHIYGTNPMKPDTDDDKLLDGEEGYNGTIYAKYGIYFDPLIPDTDNDGVLDGDEIFGQSKEQQVQTHDGAIASVSVSMNANGNIERNLNIESMYNIDAMSTNVYALIGEPFNFTTSSNFDSATIKFTIDKQFNDDQSKSGNTKFDDLIILWYNEEKQSFDEMPTTRDSANLTLSTTTTHFSQYMVVDSVKWYENWENSNDQLRKMWKGIDPYTKKLNTIFLIDCSDEMKTIDPIDYRAIEKGYNGVTEKNHQSIINDMPNDQEYYFGRYGRRMCKRASICENIINGRNSGDRSLVMTFSNGIETNTGWSASWDHLINFNIDEKKFSGVQMVNNNGSTSNLNTAVSTALSYVNNESTEITYRIILITNSNVSQYGELSTYNYKNVYLNIINLGPELIDKELEGITHTTGGDVYNAINASELTYQVGDVVYTPPEFMEDHSDTDGIPDIVELYGLKPNGQPIGTNPRKNDTDDDGLDDNVELHYFPDRLVYPLTPEQSRIMCSPVSDPAKPDSDDDGIDDRVDLEPLVKYLGEFLNKLTAMESYIDEFWTTDYAQFLINNGEIEYTSNSIVAMNIIRSILYGSGSGDKNFIKWYFTSGSEFTCIKEYINRKDPSIMEYFTGFDTGKESFKDIENNDIDFLHEMATLSGQLNTNFIGDLLINKDLSGWAGDLQSLIYYLKKDTYGTNKNLNDSACSLIANNNTNFGIKDMVSDVDARNIYMRYSQSNNLSYMIEDYYKNHSTNRYNDFVNGYGGIENLESLTNEFTYGNEIVKHKVLNNYAKSAGNELMSIYEDSYLYSVNVPYSMDPYSGTIYYTSTPIYSLPDPRKVSKAESNALTYAFITFLKENMV